MTKKELLRIWQRIDKGLEGLERLYTNAETDDLKMKSIKTFEDLVSIKNDVEEGLERKSRKAKF